MIFYFSGTGNSKWIANQLSKVQKEDLVFIPDALRDGTSEFCLREDEKVGFVFPIIHGHHLRLFYALFRNFL